MAWCENENCKKQGLRKADVEFCDTTHKVLCHGCYALMHPGWMPPAEIIDLTGEVLEPPKIGFALQLTDQDGFRARMSYGALSFSVHAPIEDLYRFIGA